MRRTIAGVLAASVVLALYPGGFGASAQVVKPPRRISPPGQVQIATVNARQNKILGVKRFEALLELAKAFRFRPPSFNGGSRDAVIAPDVAVISEFRETNVEVFGRLLRQKFDQPYEIVGPSDVQAALIVNTATVTLEGEVELIDDVCLNDESSDVPRLRREYPMARFRENTTGAQFTVVGVHIARDYSHSGQSNCLVRNVRALRERVENDPGATFLAGDFNFRPTQALYECDMNEESTPTAWWSDLVMPQDGRAYLDAARFYHRTRGLSMKDEWTYRHPSRVETCNGTIGIRQSRIDYIFASGAVVAEAHADHPGWLHADNYNYSDHRYVLGRFVLMGPPRPERAGVEPDANGVIHLTWDPVEGAQRWIVYRARKGNKYSELARLDGQAVAFDDTNTVHDATYRYSIAAIGPQGGHGVEAGAAWTTADARGPHVSSITPRRGAERVDIDTNIRVTFDEFVAASSVSPGTIRLYRNGRRVAGRVVRKGGFVVKFNPANRLRKGERYTVVVSPVQDVLGNAGPRAASRFETQPKRRRHRRR